MGVYVCVRGLARLGVWISDMFQFRLRSQCCTTRGKKKDSGEAYNNGRARASVISFHYNMMIVETILNQKI